MTLAQWIRDYRKILVFNPEDNMFSCYSPWYENARVEAEKGLDDFEIIANGPILFFHGRYLKAPVRTREEFLSLSYFTVCGVSDALMVASIEGMTNAIESGRIKGLLYTDTLGNFLFIE